jgi:hypothetical protein
MLDLSRVLSAGYSINFIFNYQNPVSEFTSLYLQCVLTMNLPSFDQSAGLQMQGDAFRRKGKIVRGKPSQGKKTSNY